MSLWIRLILLTQKYKNFSRPAEIFGSRTFIRKFCRNLDLAHITCCTVQQSQKFLLEAYSAVSQKFGSCTHNMLYDTAIAEISARGLNFQQCCKNLDLAHITRCTIQQSQNFYYRPFQQCHKNLDFVSITCCTV